MHLKVNPFDNFFTIVSRETKNGAFAPLNVSRETSDRFDSESDGSVGGSYGYAAER